MSSSFLLVSAIDFSTGASFVGANVTQGSKAVLESPSVIPTSVTTLAARIYMATYGGEIDICTGYDGEFEHQYRLK